MTIIGGGPLPDKAMRLNALADYLAGVAPATLDFCVLGRRRMPGTAEPTRAFPGSLPDHVVWRWKCGFTGQNEFDARQFLLLTQREAGELFKPWDVPLAEITPLHAEFACRVMASGEALDWPKIFQTIATLRAALPAPAPTRKPRLWGWG